MKNMTRLIIATLLLLSLGSGSRAIAAGNPEAPIQLRCTAKIPTKGLVKGKMALISREIGDEHQDLLCFGGGDLLYVYDINDPSNPVELLRKNFTGDSNQTNDLFEVIHSGGYLVLTGSYRSGGAPEGGKSPFQVGFVQVLNISDADPKNWAAPEGAQNGSWASFLEDPQSYTCSDVELEGEVGEEDCFLHISGNLRPDINLGGCLILDLSNPANPKKRGEIRYRTDGNYMGHGVCVDGRYQYHGNYYRGIYIVDYQDPDHLKVVGTLKYPKPKDATRLLVVNGKYLYTTITVAGRQNYDNGNAGVAVIDVSDPANPVFLSQTPVPQEDRPRNEAIAHDSPPHKIYFFNDKKNLLINLGAKGFAVFDIGEDSATAKYLGLAQMDEVPKGTRPMVWNDSLWVIGDGPSFLNSKPEKFVYLYKRK
jgi:hypothetical protein